MLIETKVELHSGELASCFALKFPEFDYWAEEMLVCPELVALYHMGLTVTEATATLYIERGLQDDVNMISRVMITLPFEDTKLYWHITRIFGLDQLVELEEKIFIEMQQ